MKKLKVIAETASGANKLFKDTSSNNVMTRAQVVKKIENGTYTEYHVREINNVKYPVSNPDGKLKNNLN